MAEITEAVANPETAALIAFAALGLNAGGLRFRAWLDDVPWRELFGLDQQISSGALAEGLAAIPQNEWESIILLSNVPGGGRDARFLRAPRALVGSRVAARGLAGLAHVASARFARRLIGFGDASASFLWDNLLGSGAVLLRGGAEWEARAQPAAARRRALIVAHRRRCRCTAIGKSGAYRPGGGMSQPSAIRPTLRRLDAALEREVARLRARYQLSLDEFRGLYVSDEQVDALLGARGTPAELDVLPPLEPDQATGGLLDRFGLDQAACDILLLALAPDVDPLYPTLFAYLNDDVHRRWPTVDLARRLFGSGDDIAAALTPAGPLFGAGLLLIHARDEARVPIPLTEFAANPVLSAHLLGKTVAGRRGLTIEAAPDAADADRLAILSGPVEVYTPVLAVLTGTRLCGREAAVRGLAGRFGRPVVRLQLTAETAPLDLLRDGILAARLTDGVLLVDPNPEALTVIAPALREVPLPVLLLAPEGGAWRPALAGCPLLEIAFPLPDRAIRRQLWTNALERTGLRADTAAVAEVADRFRLSSGQIDAAAASLYLGGGRGPGEQAAQGAAGLLPGLLKVAREQASAELSGLAQLVAQPLGWADLVLPGACLGQLHHLSGAIRHRERVFTDWGLAGGPGITALFSGGPGTGKSMSAAVLARDAGLDLWRIDLSAVVSKYIGETEKHLDRIFERARDGNAILFFDEADALFGKRSEVKDAHDRYANIEVAFLLQRLEAHDGVVILATNLSRNIDQAFSRRLQFVVEFPMPDAGMRERLWRAALPRQAPLAADIDVGFLSRQFEFAGGDIRVAALDAAFAASVDEAEIDMVRLLRAIGRQLQKQGKVPQASDFRHYQALMAKADAQAPRLAAAG